MNDNDASTGTYLLLLACDRVAEMTIGKLGLMTTVPGYYLYVGSAFGPGGIRARVKHHAITAARPHWHIDYLRTQADLVEAWCVFGARTEHEWAHALMRVEESVICLQGFGSSDCSCATHLFYFKYKPGMAKLEGLLGCKLHRVNMPGRE